MPLKQYDAIRLKEDIRQTLHDSDAIKENPNRTAGRDKAAEWMLQSDRVDLDNWGSMLMTELEEQSNEERDGDGWSRQHFSNVVSHYFEPASRDRGRDSSPNTDSNGSSVDRAVSRDNSPFSASPGDIEPRQRPQLAAGEEHLVAIVEDGRVQNVIDVPIPDDVSDLETYIQGVLAGASHSS